MFRRVAALGLLIAGSVFGLALGDQDDPVNVHLLDSIARTDTVVTIGDVARISGGDLITRREIAELDLAKFGNEVGRNSVSKQLVSVRILLAGISSSQYKVAGANRVQFRNVKTPSAESRILEFLRPAIAERVDLDPADILLRLTRPLPPEVTQLYEPAVEWKHFLPSSVRIGPLNAKIGIYQEGQLIRSTAIALEVQANRRVFVARRGLESGVTISLDDIVQERRVLSGQHAKYAATTVVGKKLRKSVAAGSMISELDVELPSPEKREIVIRSRDMVAVVAVRKSLRVTMAGGVALQQGAIGDSIRVKNPNSGRVLTASVVDAGVVEIRL